MSPVIVPAGGAGAARPVVGCPMAEPISKFERPNLTRRYLNIERHSCANTLIDPLICHLEPSLNSREGKLGNKFSVLYLNYLHLLAVNGCCLAWQAVNGQ
ncbi:hypothetical protein EVAR_64607_1 [Eumeta japonica]|uniref:Uncharacterized protein n=1 Tax=Eumeta variegata TaxID=151549 RepID=A0A4C1ZD75_EUMVA|nr:hypothetical protein EVAR_64607_1 [Eumeta japonica]